MPSCPGFSYIRCSCVKTADASQAIPTSPRTCLISWFGFRWGSTGSGDELQVDWQREREKRATTALTHYTYRELVCLNDCLPNWQSHSCSWDQVALVLPTVQFVKNQMLFVSINPI